LSSEEAPESSSTTWNTGLCVQLLSSSESSLQEGKTTCKLIDWEEDAVDDF
jgi:hypothetical protein